MHDTHIEAPKQYQCRHIFIDGRRCGSPCLRQEEFCYYHHTTRKPIAGPRRRSRRSAFQLPLPEDRSAIQSSIGEVLQRIASNDIDPRRAGLLLYGLQIASLNLAQSRTATKASAERETVEEISIDPTLGILAPRAEVSKATTRKSPVAQLIEDMIQSEPKIVHSASSAVLPALQAAGETTPWDQIHVRSRTFLSRCNIRRSAPLHLYRHSFANDRNDQKPANVDRELPSQNHCRSVNFGVLSATRFYRSPNQLHARSYAEQIAGEADPDAQQDQVNQIEFESPEQYQRKNHPSEGDCINPSECHCP
jgi:hypothetical protein